VIGCEGLWGTVLSLLLVYPLAYLAPGNDNGSFENPWDALTMIGNSSQLTVITFSDLTALTTWRTYIPPSMLFYNPPVLLSVTYFFAVPFSSS
jgi:hypothetical protein